MWPLFIENCRYILRSRMILLVLLFSTLVHYSGLKLVSHLTLYIQNSVTVLGPAEMLTVSLYLQLFTALSIAAVYGIWMAPYAHKGERSLLTHVLPVEKIKFPICYSFCCGLILMINELVLLAVFWSIKGAQTFSFSELPWNNLINAFAFQTLCLEVLMLFLALGSLVLGHVATVFLGASSLFIMQILGAMSSLVKNSPETPFFSLKGLFVFLFEKLPPVGNFLFDFHRVVKGENILGSHLILWCSWLVVAHLLFWVKIRYPSKNRSTEA